ncbi:hypothetical protein HYFRA_00002733 [Hymenoscyphus fraxineus]|uniref:Uncharacterized protein n=1 Tax=Hymenoscyphus fraxineus TaxID=746836 RepID=A0A9N9PNZ8_9HELO|nr:hypothetical protein HYFRA_00002733 [Hymenoscyphus fraxineus]
MGNLCGKESPDPFAQPGRTLASAPPPPENPTAPLPKKVSGPRTLGSAGTNVGGGSQQQEDARRRAAKAAEERANAGGKPKGKLASQLEQQKKQTRSETLEESSRDTRRMRDADAAADTRAYN